MSALRAANVGSADLEDLRDIVQQALNTQRPRDTRNAVDRIAEIAPGVLEKWTPRTPADRIAYLTALLTAITVMLAVYGLTHTSAPTIVNNTTIIENEGNR